MAYQNVRGTRFYVSALLWLKALGKMEGDPWGFPIFGRSFEDLLDMSKLYSKVRLIRYEDDKTLSFIKNEI